MSDQSPDLGSAVYLEFNSSLLNREHMTIFCGWREYLAILELRNCLVILGNGIMKDKFCEWEEYMVILCRVKD